MAEQRTTAMPTLVDLLFEKAGVGLCLVAPNGAVLRANSEWLRSTGLAQAQVVGEDSIGLFPGTRDLALAWHASARAGRRVEVPRQARVIDGRETWWEGSIEPVPMDGGTGLLITTREIPSSTAAAELQAVLDAVPAAVFIARDPEARRLGTNRAALEMLRVAPGENVSKSAPPEEAPTYRVFRDGVEVPAEELPVQVAAARGVEVRDWDCEVRFEDGTSRYLLAYATPIRDQSGAPAGSVSAFVDITQRKQAEEALRSSEERYRTLYEGTRDGVVLVDMQGRILDCNDAYSQMLGYTREQLRALTYIDLTPERWQAFEAATVRDQLLPRGYSEVYEKEYRRKDGTVFPVELRTKLLCDRAGTPVAAWGIVRDITERKRAEEVLLQANQQLKEAARRKDEFLAMLSHELRNPLAPIRNSTYVLRRAEPGSDQARRAQAMIERQTEHLTRIVDDLLDVTRIAHGKIELRRERVDVGEIVRRATEDYRRTIEDRGVALRIASPEEGIWADADPTRVTQIVGNLVHNAAKFTARGEIVVSVQASQGAIEIRVRDSGAGIAPVLLPHLFGAFVQGERTLARTEGGLGLGLALVKGLAELHGGTVRAESAGVGKGAEFIVSLPLVRESGEAARSPAAPPRRRAPRRVLVVDDNHDAAESLADIVQMLGHAAEVAYNGPKTIEKARASPPDVVLCDMGLPGMSGYEVARALREVLGSHVQLFALTGYAQPEDVERAVEAGFDGHLAKPYDPEEIERLLS